MTPPNLRPAGAGTMVSRRERRRLPDPWRPTPSPASLIEVSELVDPSTNPAPRWSSRDDREDRFLLDVRGYLHLPAVLGPAEVAEARAALERVVEGYESGALPSTSGWGLGLEPSLQRLCTHPDLLPIIDEFTEGAPHLVSTGAIVNKAPPPAQREAGQPAGSAQLLPARGRHPPRRVSCGALGASPATFRPLLPDRRFGRRRRASGA